MEEEKVENIEVDETSEITSAEVTEDAPVLSKPQDEPKQVAKEEVVKEQPAKEEIGRGGLKQLDSEKENLPWFVVHVYSGFESRVKLTLEERIRTEGVANKFGHIVVPEENVVEVVRGEKKASKKKFFPGYILVQCRLDEQTWHIVTGTPKVTGFVGDALNPSPLSPEEVNNLMQQMEGKGPKARASIDFVQGDAVKVIDGPFAEFNGTVDDVKPDKGKLRVLISIFGRNTPVELDFGQVEKV